MKTRPTAERELLHAVVLDDVLREQVYAACVRQLRNRAQVEATLLDAVMDEGADDLLEMVRRDCQAALRPPSPHWIRGFARVAAAVLVLVVAGLLIRPSPAPAPASVRAVVEPSPAVPGYIVRTRPVAEDITVRTGDHALRVVRIGDDELLATLPGLSLARTRDVEGNPTVFVGQPAGRLYRIN